MAMLHLHSRLNPQRMVIQNSEEIASVEFYFDGSLITSNRWKHHASRGETRRHRQTYGGTMSYKTTQDMISEHMALVGDTPTLTKLDALRILASAYCYLDATILLDSAGVEAFITLEHAFGYIRRSLRIHDLKPVNPIGFIREGYNPSGPRWL